MEQSSPVSIYLETSVLRGLPIEIADENFLQLKSYCDQLHIPLLVPELCVSELVHHRKNEVRVNIRQASSAVANVARYLATPPTLNWGEDSESMLADVETRVRSYFADNGLTIIPTPEIALSTLLEMAVQKVRPFEERGEKGFRDSVILFTVLGYAKSSGEGYHLLLSGDGIFEHQDVRARAQSDGVDLKVVKSIPAAVDHLKQFVNDTIRRFLELRSEVLRGYLAQHAAEIQRFIQERGEFTSSFLLSDESFASLVTRIQGIENIELIDIVNAQPGYLPIDATEGEVQVSFGAKVKFTLSTLLVSPPMGQTFRARQEQEPEASSFPDVLANILISARAQDEQQRRREVTKVVSVSGSAHLVKATEEYTGLDLHEVRGSSLFERWLWGPKKAMTRGEEG